LPPLATTTFGRATTALATVAPFLCAINVPFAAVDSGVIGVRLGEIPGAVNLIGGVDVVGDVAFFRGEFGIILLKTSKSIEFKYCAAFKTFFSAYNLFRSCAIAIFITSAFPRFSL
jgi:hypothetical protein